MTLLDDFLGKKNTFSPKLNEPQTRPPVEQKTPEKIPMVCGHCGQPVEVIEPKKQAWCPRCNKMLTKYEEEITYTMVSKFRPKFQPNRPESDFF